MSIKKDVERILYLLPAPEEPTSQELVEARKKLIKNSARWLRRTIKKLEQPPSTQNEMRA